MGLRREPSRSAITIPPPQPPAPTPPTRRPYRAGPQPARPRRRTLHFYVRPSRRQRCVAEGVPFYRLLQPARGRNVNSGLVTISSGASEPHRSRRIVRDNTGGQRPDTDPRGAYVTVNHQGRHPGRTRTPPATARHPCVSVRSALRRLWVEGGRGNRLGSAIPRLATVTARPLSRSANIGASRSTRSNAAAVLLCSKPRALHYLRGTRYERALY